MNKYSSTLAFVDLLFNLLLAFVSLFILSFILINPQKEAGIIDPNAEFIITSTWDGQLDDDVDLWVEDPEGNRVYFGDKEVGLMHLDRDDQGIIQDRISTRGAEIVYPYNQEIVTLRGFIPGEYTVNIHMYSKNSVDPVLTHVQVIKLNPYSTVCDKEIALEYERQEKTICRFRLSSTGRVTEVNELPKRLFGRR
jgi:hypothetical protein